MSHHHGKAQIRGEAELPEHRKKGLSDAQRKEAELEEFYAHQQKAMEKRLEVVFRQINDATSSARDETPNASRRPASASGPPETRNILKDTIEGREIEACLLKHCKMTAKHVAACTRGPAGPPVKPLDQVPYIEDMIWEVDENGCGSIDLAQFKRCYERAAADRSGFEPRKLATLVDFLLMDEENLGYVTEDQISELMTARYGFSLDDAEVVCMLGKKGDLAAKAEHISYPEFVKRMARSLRIQRKKHGMRKDSYVGDGTD